MEIPRGKIVHGEVVSADASGGVAFKFYLAGTDATEESVGTTDYLHITDVELISAVGGDVGIFTVTDAAGKRVVKGNVVANGGIVQQFRTPHCCGKGITPKLIADAGAVVGVIHGFITSG